MPDSPAMACPHCHEPLDVVLDLPYGYWKWDGARYVLTTTGPGVDVAPWVCRSCLRELRSFHPQDVTAERLGHPVP